MSFLVAGLVLLAGGPAAVAPPLGSLLRGAGFAAPADGAPVPDFELRDLEGRTLRLREQRGKVVFLNFWATSCPPCRREMPLMNALHVSLRGRPFAMWAVAVRESERPVATFVEEYGLGFPALLDRNGTVSGRYGAWALPATFLIDCAGDLVGQAYGPRHWTSVTTRALMDELLSDSRCDARPGEPRLGPR